MARPRKQIDIKLLEGLANIGCADTEIATLVGVSVDTLNRRFAEILCKGRETLKTRLRKLQLRAAEDGNVTMLIWLGKQYLGQREPKVEFDVTALDAAIERQLARLAAGSQTEIAGEAESESVH